MRSRTMESYEHYFGDLELHTKADDLEGGSMRLSFHGCVTLDSAIVESLTQEEMTLLQLARTQGPDAVLRAIASLFQRARELHDMKIIHDSSESTTGKLQ